MTEARKGMPNRKASGPDGLPAERLNIDHPAFVQCFDNNILVNVWVLGEVLQHWKFAILKVLQNTKDRTDCNNYTGIYFASCPHRQSVVENRHLSKYCENEGTVPEEQHCDLPPTRSTIRLQFVVRRL